MSLVQMNVKSSTESSKGRIISAAGVFAVRRSMQAPKFVDGSLGKSWVKNCIRAVIGTGQLPGPTGWQPPFSPSVPESKPAGLLPKSLGFASALFLNFISSASPNLPSTQLQLNCNCSSCFPQAYRISFNMFRNALRQSSRAVGAISATGRVAAVSLLILSTGRPRPPSIPSSDRPQSIARDLDQASLSCCMRFGLAGRAF